jgi:ABC-type transport system substrate-binding protein
MTGKCRELLEASSYEGETITFHTASTYYTNGLLAAQAVTEMWKAIGVNTQLLVDTNTEDFWTEVMVANWSIRSTSPTRQGLTGSCIPPAAFAGQSAGQANMMNTKRSMTAFATPLTSRSEKRCTERC